MAEKVTSTLTASKMSTKWLIIMIPCLYTRWTPSYLQISWIHSDNEMRICSIMDASKTILTVQMVSDHLKAWETVRTNWLSTLNGGQGISICPTHRYHNILQTVPLELWPYILHNYTHGLWVYHVTLLFNISQNSMHPSNVIWQPPH